MICCRRQAKLQHDIDDIQDRVLVDEIQTFSPLYTQAQISGWLMLGDKLGALLANDAAALAELGQDACTAT